ncbi:MAG: 1-aminocyclopropane-1-carboxylate deaminase/D-cysteine desulfhydrase, partial [Marinirhabdus sp.]
MPKPSVPVYPQKPQAIVQPIDYMCDPKNKLSLHILREDLPHPYVSGNKYRKLKYNLIAAASRNHSTLLTYGGAYSNHIAAVARAGKLHGFRTIGVIRGEELCDRVNGNPTLSFAKRQGMQLYFITRAAYAQKIQG